MCNRTQAPMQPFACVEPGHAGDGKTILLCNSFNQSLGDLDKNVLPNDRTGDKDTLFWQKVYTLQSVADTGIINKLETCSACILVDRVGLGKYFAVLAVVKHYELRNKSMLVLSPKKLADNCLTARTAAAGQCSVWAWRTCRQGLSQPRTTEAVACQFSPLTNLAPLAPRCLSLAQAVWPPGTPLRQGPMSATLLPRQGNVEAVLLVVPAQTVLAPERAVAALPLGQLVPGFLPHPASFILALGGKTQ